MNSRLDSLSGLEGSDEDYMRDEKETGEGEGDEDEIMDDGESEQGDDGGDEEEEVDEAPENPLQGNWRYYDYLVYRHFNQTELRILVHTRQKRKLAEADKLQKTDARQNIYRYSCVAEVGAYPCTFSTHDLLYFCKHLACHTKSYRLHMNYSSVCALCKTYGCMPNVLPVHYKSSHGMKPDEIHKVSQSCPLIFWPLSEA